MNLSRCRFGSGQYADVRWGTSGPTPTSLWPEMCNLTPHVRGLIPSYTANYIVAEGVQLETLTDLDDDTATLMWLIGALGQAR